MDTGIAIMLNYCSQVGLKLILNGIYLYPKETVNYGITYPMGVMALDWIEIDSRWYYLYPKETVNYGITYPMGSIKFQLVLLA